MRKHMTEKETKIPAKTHTGMIKRSNPLSLEKEVSVFKEVSKPSPTKKPADKKVINNTKSKSVVLTGPKQIAMFMPIFNKELVKTIKAKYPDLSYVQIIEKAWLLLLSLEQPKAYEALLATIEKQGKL